MYHYGEYDACEFSMSSYLVAKSQDVGWFHAIPFFPRRMFSHKFCFIRAGSSIKKPAASARFRFTTSPTTFGVSGMRPGYGGGMAKWQPGGEAMHVLWYGRRS